MKLLAILLSLIVASSGFDACKEPKLCDCLWDCSVLSDEREYQCDFGLIVVPNLGVWFGPRHVRQIIVAAEEKLEMEESSLWEGRWKKHVIGKHDIAVKDNKGLLAVWYALLKSTYESRINARMKGLLETRCDIGKCIGFCVDVCNNQCEMEKILDSADTVYLEEIGWSTDACDLDVSKAKMKKMCNDVKVDVLKCDANCDKSLMFADTLPIGALPILINLV